jgi:hypothetical protein
VIEAVTSDDGAFGTAEGIVSDQTNFVYHFFK